MAGKNCLQQLWSSAVEADSKYARICAALLAEDEEARDVHHKVLQAELARARGVAADQSTIRKFFQSKGYRWLPRGQKRKYTPQQMSERKAFAEAVVALGPRRL